MYTSLLTVKTDQALVAIPCSHSISNASAIQNCVERLADQRHLYTGVHRQHACGLLINHTAVQRVARRPDACWAAVSSCCRVGLRRALVPQAQHLQSDSGCVGRHTLEGT